MFEKASLRQRLPPLRHGPDGNISFSASDPAVAYNSRDNEYLVVWSGDDTTAPLVDNEYEIFGQRLNAATGRSGSGSYAYSGSLGVGVGGGLSVAPPAPPLADLDTFTESNTVNNFADIDPNLAGPYSLNGTFVRTPAISDVTAAEGNTGTTAFVFTVTLSAPISQPITVAYATANGTATAGSDYQAGSGTLTIPADQSTGTITILVIGDRLPEPNKTFFVNLSGATNATIADGQGLGTIVDDEPRISINDVTKYEGNKGKKTSSLSTMR